MYAAKTAVEATTFKPAPYLLNQVTRLGDLLELIQRALEKYLETKRHIFPRFYFISNDDMLEILGNARKPEAVQPHFKKLFDNLNKLKLSKVISKGTFLLFIFYVIFSHELQIAVSNKSEALGMFSEDGEYMEFPKPLLLDGAVEHWLCEVENIMRYTLRVEFKPCRNALKKMLNKRDKWLLTYCGQLCNACSQVIALAYL